MWDLLKDEDLELVPSLSLRRHSTDISHDGQYLTYEENGELVTRRMSASGGFTSVSSTPLDQSRDIAAVKFCGSDLLIVYKTGLLCKRAGTPTADGSLVFTEEKFMQLPLEDASDLLMSLTDNKERAILVARDFERNHIFYILDMKTLAIESTIIASRRNISGDISAFVIDSTDGMVVFAGTSSGELLRLEFDVSSKSVRVSSYQRRHENTITCLAVSASRKYLFTGSTGRKRRLWEINVSEILGRVTFGSDPNI